MSWYTQKHTTHTNTLLSLTSLSFIPRYTYDTISYALSLSLNLSLSLCHPYTKILIPRTLPYLHTMYDFIRTMLLYISPTNKQPYSLPLFLSQPLHTLLPISTFPLSLSTFLHRQVHTTSLSLSLWNVSECQRVKFGSPHVFEVIVQRSNLKKMFFSISI